MGPSVYNKLMLSKDGFLLREDIARKIRIHLKIELEFCSCCLEHSSKIRIVYMYSGSSSHEKG